MHPDFVIIGAQKSASTFIHRCLEDHPDVYMHRQEVPYFESPDYEQGTLAEIERLFEGREESRLGIKRPAYLGDPDVPERIAADLPDVKLIGILRDPAARAVSAYFHNARYGFIPALPVEVGLRKIITEPAFLEAYPRAKEIIPWGRYHECLQRYLEHFPRERMLMMLHRDVIADPLGAVQQVYAFLEVDADVVPDSLASRPQAVVYNLTRLRWLRMGNRFLFDYNEDRTRNWFSKPTLAKRLIVQVINLTDRFLLKPMLGNDKPKLSADLHRLVYEQYVDDIDKLERLLDRDLSDWRPAT